MTRLRRALEALFAFARGFVGIPAQTSHRACPHEARAALGEAAARRGRCC